MSVYTKALNFLGYSEARRIEVAKNIVIKALEINLSDEKSKNKLLRSMMIKMEERHINDITLINEKLDTVSRKLNEMSLVAESNKNLITKYGFSEEQRLLFMSLLEEAMNQHPELKLSDLIKKVRENDKQQ